MIIKYLEIMLINNRRLYIGQQLYHKCKQTYTILKWVNWHRFHLNWNSLSIFICWIRWNSMGEELYICTYICMFPTSIFSSQLYNKLSPIRHAESHFHNIRSIFIDIKRSLDEPRTTETFLVLYKYCILTSLENIEAHILLII